jgi:hypothetical protein
MNKNNQPMFKMLFRDELFTMEDVMRAAEKNPDLLWVVYETKQGNADIQRRESLGKMSCTTIMQKYG